MPETSAAVAPRQTVDYEMVDGPLSAWAAANWLRHFEELHAGCEGVRRG